ncbi:hypothetical protein [Xanthomonas hortorum]|uniref:hypothetical protein n=1 Tax=Xanthomonas hortorum TaxID=56454 RepID=UPI0005C67016|nr:hypothetical protein [Xanthomonas hortorum]
MKPSERRLFLEMLAIIWGLAFFISLLILAFYFLAEPWSWIAFVFLVATAIGVVGFFTAGGHEH